MDLFVPEKQGFVALKESGKSILQLEHFILYVIC